MPELPEVETTRRGIEPHLCGRTVTRLIVRQPKLRWPVPRGLAKRIEGRSLRAVGRRGKYLLIDTGAGVLILHLGMSGSLRVVPAETPAEAHDHVDLVLDSGRALRLRDPRRFGCLLWADDPENHPLLRDLGPEPLSEAFDGGCLYTLGRRRRVPVKAFIMNSRIVVGVGNIYANEALFMAGIHPARPAGRISRERYARLAAAIKEVLTEAIGQGGTTLRDFLREDGRPGYFQVRLQVYDRAGRPCPRCGGPIRQQLLGQRSTFYCPRCQT